MRAINQKLSQVSLGLLALSLQIGCPAMAQNNGPVLTVSPGAQSSADSSQAAQPAKPTAPYSAQKPAVAPDLSATPNLAGQNAPAAPLSQAEIWVRDRFNPGGQSAAQMLQQKKHPVQRLDTSEMIVRGQAGDEVVDAAQQAFLEARQNDPSLQQKFDSQKHPYAWLMSWHKQHQIMSEIGTDPEAWRNAQLEKLRAELLQSQKTPAAVAQPSAPSQQPPPSLAAQPAARHAPTPHVGPGNAFDRAIPR